jgi:hypothetical protein
LHPNSRFHLPIWDGLAIATSGKSAGVVRYNVQAAVDPKNHLSVEHEVTNVGHDRGQLSKLGKQAQAD